MLRLSTASAGRLLSVAVLMLAAACGGTDDPVGPGTPPANGPVALTATLTTPNADDGALLLTIGGGLIDSLQAGTGITLRAAPPSGTTRRVLVTGNLATGTTLFRLWIPDAAAADVYTVTFSQAAAKGSYVQRALTGYQVRLTQ
jgi:hypothetical protein